MDGKEKTEVCEGREAGEGDLSLRFPRWILMFADWVKDVGKKRPRRNRPGTRSIRFFSRDFLQIRFGYQQIILRSI